MKKIICVIAVLVISLAVASIVVVAAEPHAETIDPATGIVRITGTSLASSRDISILVTDPDTNERIHVGETIANSDGSFEYTFRMIGTFKMYNILLGNQLADGSSIQISFMLITDADAIVALLNAANTAESVRALVEEFGAIFGFSDIDATPVADIFTALPSTILSRTLNAQERNRIWDALAAKSDFITVYDVRDYFGAQVLFRVIETYTSNDDIVTMLTTARYVNLLGLDSAAYNGFMGMNANDRIRVVSRMRNAMRAPLDLTVVRREFASAEDFVRRNPIVSGDTTGSGGQGGNFGGGSISFPLTGQQNQGPGPSAEHRRFPDVTADFWAFGTIDRMAQLGIISGHPDGLFAPNDAVTREQFVRMIVVAFNIPRSGVTGAFNDMPAEHWAATYVEAASAAGIIQGIGDGLFGTGFNITREDAAVIIYNTATRFGGLVSAGASADFNDSAYIAGYAQNAVGELVNTGVITGLPGGMFAPRNTTTRAEAATMIYRLMVLAGREVNVND